jgi:hypothetical protein
VSGARRVRKRSSPWGATFESSGARRVWVRMAPPRARAFDPPSASPDGGRRPRSWRASIRENALSERTESNGARYEVAEIVTYGPANSFAIKHL